MWRGAFMHRAADTPAVAGVSMPRQHRPPPVGVSLSAGDSEGERSPAPLFSTYENPSVDFRMKRAVLRHDPPLTNETRRERP